MEGLSQEQVDAFKQEIEDTQVNTQPLISDSFPFETLMIEFEAGNPNFLEKLRILSPDFAKYRKSRGDGNCFFRAFAFRFFELFSCLPDFPARLEALQADWWGVLEAAKFQRIAYEDFLEEALELMKQYREKVPILRAAEVDPSDWLAEDWRNNPVCANTMIIVFRMLVSAYLQLNAEEYLPFIYEFSSPEMELQPAKVVMEDFCRRNVEAMGVESDQIHIIAITKLLGCQVEIVYLDSSQSAENLIMSFGDDSCTLFNEPITLLYRPGHYDIIYRK